MHKLYKLQDELCQALETMAERGVSEQTLPTIDKQNTMTMLSRRWTPEPLPQGHDDGVDRLMASSREGGMSLCLHGSNLVVHSEDNADVTLQVFTLSGTPVMSTPLRLASGHGQVNVSLLSTGTYIARLQAADGSRCAIKFRM